MTFYELFWWDDAAPSGITHRFYQRRRDAVADRLELVARLKAAIALDDVADDGTGVVRDTIQQIGDIRAIETPAGLRGAGAILWALNYGANR